jgi:uncharacterized protein YdiU (UPF0061 family)
MMGRKLGWDKIDVAEIELISEIEKMLAATHPDMTLFFQSLIDMPLQEDAWQEHFSSCFYQPLNEAEQQLFTTVMRLYAQRVEKNKAPKEDIVNVMRQSSPRFILRNYLLHQAIEELQEGNDTLFRQLEAAIKDPYSNRHDHFFQKRPEWATQKAGCSMLSCSS